MDVLGSALNRLPLIGPVRVQLVKEFKKVVDAAVGEQLKTFLASYNRVALQRVIDFVLSKENQAYLGKANKALIENLISRPICELLSPHLTVKLKSSLWSSIDGVAEADLLAQLDLFYSAYGSRSLRPVVSAATKVPGARHAAARGLSDFLSSAEGVEAKRILLSS